MAPGWPAASLTEYAVESGTTDAASSGRPEQADAEQRRRERAGERLKRGRGIARVVDAAPAGVQRRGAGDETTNAPITPVMPSRRSRPRHAVTPLTTSMRS